MDTRCVCNILVSISSILHTEVKSSPCLYLLLSLYNKRFIYGGVFFQNYIRNFCSVACLLRSILEQLQKFGCIKLASWNCPTWINKSANFVYHYMPFHQFLCLSQPSSANILGIFYIGCGHPWGNSWEVTLEAKVCPVASYLWKLSDSS